jgi:heme exporter protein B
VTALRREAGFALAIARKDALAELRGRHATVSTLFFAAVVLLLFGFALGPDSARLAAAAPGLLWLAIVFAGILAVNRLHLLETDDGALEHLALYPITRRSIYAGKAIGGFAVMLVLGVVVLGAVGVLFAVDIIGAWLPLLVTVVLGAAGIAAVGTFYAGVTVRLRAREVMLPVLAPLLLGAVKATGAALAGDPFGELGAWLQLLVAFDVIMVVAGAATYGYLLED